MSSTNVFEGLSRKASVISSRSASIVSSLGSDVGSVRVRYVKSSSFDLGPAKEGSVYIVSFGEGSVNQGFVKDESIENVSGDLSNLGKGSFSEEQSESNGNDDKISVMVIGPLEEPVNGWPFATEQNNDPDETKMKRVLAGQNEQDQMSQPHPEKSSSSDKLTLRDYMIVLSIFIITFISYGNVGSMSVLTVEWLREFKDSKSLILYVANLAYALMSAVGILDGILINRFGVFNMMFIGCILQVVCIIGSSFSPNAVVLIIILGLLLGFALCFSYLNAFIVMGIQFGSKGKFFITALSITGPLCGIVFPNMIPVFIEAYAWRGSMFMLAAISMQMIPLSFFVLLSQKNKKKKQKYKEKLKEDIQSKTEAIDTVSSAKKTIDLSLFRDPLYVAYIFSVTFTLSGVNAMYSMLPSFLNMKGLELKEAAALYSIYSFSSVLPRSLMGVIQRWARIRFIYIYIGTATGFGLMFILIPQANSYSVLFVCCVVMSLFMAIPGGLYTIGVLECVGTEKYSIGTSIAETSYGAFSAISGYLAGLLVTYMDSYEETFSIYGAFILASTFCLLVTVIVQNWRDKKNFSQF